MDLIDRKSLLIQIEISPQNAFIRNTPLAMDLRKLYSNVIKLAPTVGAVEVVYCEDCKYYSRSGFCRNGNITSNCDCDLEKEPNGFCDWGERRGD